MAEDNDDEPGKKWKLTEGRSSKEQYLAGLREWRILGMSAGRHSSPLLHEGQSLAISSTGSRVKCPAGWWPANLH